MKCIIDTGTPINLLAKLDKMNLLNVNASASGKKNIIGLVWAKINMSMLQEFVSLDLGGKMKNYRKGIK